MYAQMENVLNFISERVAVVLDVAIVGGFERDDSCLP